MLHLQQCCQPLSDPRPSMHMQRPDAACVLNIVENCIGSAMPQKFVGDHANICCSVRFVAMHNQPACASAALSGYLWCVIRTAYPVTTCNMIVLLKCECCIFSEQCAPFTNMDYAGNQQLRQLSRRNKHCFVTFIAWLRRLQATVPSCPVKEDQSG